MQKIVIKNFGVIQDAEIDIKQILILIGEQASGKSTIAKLIYFFKSLRDDLFGQMINLTQDDEVLKKFRMDVNTKFRKWFGSNNDSFQIRYYYNYSLDKYIEINKNGKLYEVEIADSLFDDTFLAIKKQYRNDFGQHERKTSIKYALHTEIFSSISKYFDSYQEDTLYVVAGRTATVSYSELFERELYARLWDRINHAKNGLGIVDDYIMYEFINKILEIKTEFKNLDFEEENQNSDYLKGKITAFLRAEYQIDNVDERITPLGSKKSIPLYLASSGQQEMIRILQDVLLLILHNNQKVLRIIEEPEAHLFPVTQKQIIELLTQMVNQGADNQLIITTHSPYVLTVFNNLLFAKRVIDKNSGAEGEVNAVIPRQSWLNTETFEAYSLSIQKQTQEKYCESIYDESKSSIQQNYLDTVSEALGGDFQALYRIHAKTFARK